MIGNQNNILSVIGLEIGYVSGRTGNALLPPLYAHAGKGELIAVIGRNGIGKSTLLRTIAGLQQSLGGEILFRDKSIRGYSRLEMAKEVGYISTEIVKVSNMSVYDLVSLGRYPYTNWIGKIDAENHNLITEAIKSTSMSGFSERFISELSDGERQRAMIARLIAQDTEIMVMDEPTAFLDIGSKYEILHLMSRLAHNNDKTILYSTHDMHMAISMSDRIWLIIDNHLVEGSPEDLMIAGMFDHLFDSSPVRFNSDDGTFDFSILKKGSIFLEGDGIKKHWTEKAINRAGYTVSKKRTIPCIRVPDEKDKFYILQTNKSEYKFSAIYDLIRFLSKNDLLTS